MALCILSLTVQLISEHCKQSETFLYLLAWKRRGARGTFAFDRARSERDLFSVVPDCWLRIRTVMSVCLCSQAFFNLGLFLEMARPGSTSSVSNVDLDSNAHS